MKERQLIINIIVGVVSFGLSLGINFILSPYIVETLGVEANGYTTLANNMLSYITVITVAINSMSNRFISIEAFNDKHEEAKKYYSAAVCGNIFVALVCLPIFILFVLNITSFLNISVKLVIDVQFLFSFLFINFFISLFSYNLSVAFYIKNKLYISSFISIFSTLARALIIVLLFTSFKPFVAFVGFSTLVAGLITFICNAYFKQKLLPDYAFSYKYFDRIYLKDLLSSGIWNTISQIGNMLSTGLDLLITNIFIGEYEMGILSIAKAIPSIINELLTVIVSCFLPDLTMQYAKNNMQAFCKEVSYSMRLNGFLLNVPPMILIVFGKELFSLWYPTLDANFLYILSTISAIPWLIMGCSSILLNILAILNKIKLSSIIGCVFGFANVCVVALLLARTNMGVFGIVIVSSIMNIIRYFSFVIPYTSFQISGSLFTFFPVVFKSFFVSLICMIIGFCLKNLIPLNTWVTFIFGVFLFCIIVAVLEFFLLLTKNDRFRLYQILKK